MTVYPDGPTCDNGGVSFADSTPDSRFTPARKAAELAAIFGYGSIDAMPANVREFVVTRLLVLGDDDLQVLEGLVAEVANEKTPRPQEPVPSGGGLKIVRRPAVTR